MLLLTQAMLLPGNRGAAARAAGRVPLPSYGFAMHWPVLTYVMLLPDLSLEHKQRGQFYARVSGGGLKRGRAKKGGGGSKR